MDILKILTLNCQKGYHPDLKEYLIHTLESGKYDFLLLQGVTQDITNTVVAANASYKIVNPFDANLNDTTGVCVLYKQEFALKDSFFVSFAKTSMKMSENGWGFVGGVFGLGDNEYVIGSTHLHPGLNFSLRRKELRTVKQELLKYKDKACSIFGGDFNASFARELVVTKRILLPEFVRVAKRIGQASDMKIADIAPFIFNKISIFLSQFGIGYTFRTDHIYVNAKAMRASDVTCSMLPDRVSDHHPVELIITPYSRHNA